LAVSKGLALGFESLALNSRYKFKILVLIARPLEISELFFTATENCENSEFMSLLDVGRRKLRDLSYVFWNIVSLALLRTVL